MMFLMALPVLVVNHIPAAFRSFISCTISLITTEDPCPSEHRCASDFEPPLKAFRPEQVEISVPKKMCSQNNIYGCMFWLTQKVGASFHIFAVEESKVFPLCKSLCCKASSSWPLLIINAAAGTAAFVLLLWEQNAALFSTCKSPYVGTLPCSLQTQRVTAAHLLQSLGQPAHALGIGRKTVSIDHFPVLPGNVGWQFCRM